MSSSPSGAPPAADLRERLADVMLRDQRRLRRRLERARSDGPTLDEVAHEIAKAEQRVVRRRMGVPAVSYPPELPITDAREELLAAIRDHQVVVVAGETGSGKTTQLPKMCLELGRGVQGLIGHTQPRRIAARSVADRIASELGVDVGAQVGFQIRFSDRTDDRTLVKLMTDGILLAEIQRDPTLSAYDTIIIDEAHERSLNIDFLLGYLHQLLPRRPDLKLVITSATIDTARFAQHFGEAPVIEVSGRTFPVEVRYRPLGEDDADDDEDQITAICRAVEELTLEGPGDILVFLSGEREIRDTADAVRGMDLRDTEVLPLYARLSTAEQQRVFADHTGRRVVLATNVAETSLTVPGIRYVVDPGTARISRYSNRTKVQRLPIEKISQASADQRAGRCGRVADGICIRLYDEEDFEARPAFTDPEILRTNLASVILQMTALGLGEVEHFPFVDPPDPRSVRDAVQLLHELHAVESAQRDARPKLTKTGRVLARLPVDPRLGRMLVEADRSGCLREALIVVSALSIQDPRERPSDKRDAADAQHERFADAASDFLAFGNLWTYLREQQHALSSSAFRRRCKAEFLHYLRVREWQDLHSQLRAACKEQGMRVTDTPAPPEALHQALLAGMLSLIGMREGTKREYQGARGTRFWIWPGSALADSPPDWVMAAELVETSRLWARTVARIEPAWVERLAGHLVERTHSEPRWSRKRGAVVASERVTLYGVPLVASRTVTYSTIDPEVSRELFIRHALVQGEWRTSHAFWEDNQRHIADLGELEHRARRRDIVVDDDALFAFYDARVPASVVSVRHFDSWWKDARRTEPDRLTLTPDALLVGAGTGVDVRDYPGVWRAGDAELAVSYRFAPGEPDDGVVVQVPLPVLSMLEAAPFAWQVPGYREELVTALIKSLPKAWRRGLVPVAETVAKVLPRLTPRPGAVTDALTREVAAATGVTVPPDAWDWSKVPDHLRITFRVVDDGKVMGQGKDLPALQRQLSPAMRTAVAQSSGIERTGQTAWTFGPLPEQVQITRDGHAVTGYPALVDEGPTVGVRVLLTPAEQQRAMWLGTRRLLLLSVPPPVKAVHGRIDNATKLVLSRNPHGSVLALVEDCATCAVEALLADAGGPVWDPESFAALRSTVAGQITPRVLDVVRAVAGVLRAAQAVEARLADVTSPTLRSGVDDARAHLAGLVHPGFVTATGPDRLRDLERYVRGIEVRLSKLGQDPARDAALAERVHAIREEYRSLLTGRRPAGNDTALREIRWMIEELRVSLFAQQLGTRYPISEQRIFRAIADVAVRG